MIALAENTYGKSGVRLVKVKRDGPLHTLKEWKVEVLLSGDFESCFTAGDNSEHIAYRYDEEHRLFASAREHGGVYRRFCPRAGRVFSGPQSAGRAGQHQHRQLSLGACRVPG